MKEHTGHLSKSPTTVRLRNRQSTRRQLLRHQAQLSMQAVHMFLRTSKPLAKIRLAPHLPTGGKSGTEWDPTQLAVGHLLPLELDNHHHCHIPRFPVSRRGR